MKRLLIVGAGSCQINAIKRMKAMGHFVIAADYNLWTEGKALADQQILADAFDVETIYQCALENQIDGILTVGTDQPVFVVNTVADRLELTHFIDVETAFWVTNKKAMKNRFAQFKIPTTPFAVVRHNFSSAALTGLKPPYVIKPIDSQGQRGIYKVDTIDEIRMHFDDVLKYSRSEEILVESFYESTEVTISGWVTKGKASIFTITDRVTFPSDVRIGVCIGHQFPSVHQSVLGHKMVDLTQTICSHFNIDEGPIYFQYLIGDKGILVNEIACRLGGAYEDVTIPYVTGVDVLSLNIRSSYEHLTEFRGYTFDAKSKPFNTQLFFCKPGKIVNMLPVSELKALPFILDAGYNIRMGDVIENIENASQRAGFFIVTGDSEAEIEANIIKVYQILEIKNAEGKNLVVSYDEARNQLLTL